MIESADKTPALSRVKARGRDGQEVERVIIVETPVHLVYGGLPYAVMMACPQDLEDFIIGFSLTEGVIAALSDIKALEIAREAEGWAARIDLRPARLQDHLRRRRNLAGRSGCGVCGVETMADLPRAQPLRSGFKVSAQALTQALKELPAHQPLHDATKAAHAAAWCDASGRILLAREDVGRHNALDKAIGACLRLKLSPQDGFMLVTSRCSFEMVEKTAAFGASALVAMSAPTSLALVRARALGLTLIANAQDALIFNTIF